MNVKITEMQELPEVLPFYDTDSGTISYIVKDPSSNSCAVVDSVLDFDYAAGQIHYESADKIIACIKAEDLQLELLLETHIHADHLSAAPYIQKQLGGRIAISKHVVEIQQEFGKLFNEGTEFQRDGTQFDILFDEDQHYSIGGLEGLALYTPGHTAACITHVIGGAAFVGDTLFMPDAGTARADFPGGDARTLFKSIQRVLSLPDDTRLYMCHDYQPDDRELAFISTVAEQKANNIHVNKSISEQQFVNIREGRDAGLDMPRLILPALQVNMRAGHFPLAKKGEKPFLKIPVSGLNFE
ncbi:MAG: glyoxylase-like metal-dependent hydrolase (beta-lactamase superfamily II) [Cryomorphaceae bacterium]